MNYNISSSCNDNVLASISKAWLMLSLPYPPYVKLMTQIFSPFFDVKTRKPAYLRWGYGKLMISWVKIDGKLVTSDFCNHCKSLSKEIKGKTTILPKSEILYPQSPLLFLQA